MRAAASNATSHYPQARHVDAYTGIASPETTRADAYERTSLADATLRAYAHDWAAFSTWAAQRNLHPLPAAPETVGRYLADCADHGRAIAGLRRCAAAISRAHAARGELNPCTSAYVRNVLAGIARTRRAAPRKKDALTMERLRSLVEECDTSLAGLRDRALILLGFAGAFRRGEVAALDLTDLRWSPRGLIVTVRRSKTDQEGRGAEVGVPCIDDVALCPVRALRAWMDSADITEGPLFRTFARRRGRAAQALTTRRIDPADVARILQRALARAGIFGNYAAHSLRAGFITAAAASGVAEIDIARVSRHKSAEVLRGYIRRATALEDPPFAVMAANGK